MSRAAEIAKLRRQQQQLERAQREQQSASIQAQMQYAQQMQYNAQMQYQAQFAGGYTGGQAAWGGSYGYYAQPPPPPPPSSIAPPPDPFTLQPPIDEAAPQREGEGGEDDEEQEEEERETVVRDKASNVLALHGNQSNFNINVLLHRNITESDYFRSLQRVSGFHELLKEIETRVSHLEAWQAGTSRVPSTAFCLLLRLLQLRLSVRQMRRMLSSSSPPVCRALGLLYLRYTCPPSDLFSWFEALLEEDKVAVRAAADGSSMAMSAYAKRLLSEIQYFGTALPRIPLLTERIIKVRLLLVDGRKERRGRNAKLLAEGRRQLGVGSRVKALYFDTETNKAAPAAAFYEAVVDQVYTSQEQEQDEQEQEQQQEGEGNGAGAVQGNPLQSTYLVTFVGYGNQERLDLGDLELLDDQHAEAGAGAGAGAGADDEEAGTGGSRKRVRGSPEGEKDLGLLDRVLQEARQASTAEGKNYAARGVASLSSSFALKLDRNTARPASPPPASASASASGAGAGAGAGAKRAREREEEAGPEAEAAAAAAAAAEAAAAKAKADKEKKRQEALDRLKQQYGDASRSSLAD